MKKMILICLFLVFQQSEAKTLITCEEQPFSIMIQVDELESDPMKSKFEVYKNGKLVKSDYFIKDIEGYSDSLGFYFWEFSNKNQDSIGIGTQDFSEPSGGIWSGFSDLIINTSEGFWSGSTVECEIEID